MAPRGYLAEVALLTSASEDLAAVGPGEREGWLDDPAVLPPLAPRARALAVAVAARSVHAVAPVAGGGGRVTVRPALGPDDGRISAVEWIPLAGEDPGEAGERVAVAVGTDARLQELLSGGSGDSLWYIYLACCNFHPKVRIGHLKCLTRIQLCMVNITENGLSSLLSISLGLERLELRHCSTIKSLKIPCLQRLSYLEVMTCDGLRVIESKAPNLSSFRFAGDLCVYKYHLVKQCKLSKSTAFYARTELPSSMPNLERLLIHSDTEMVNTQMLPSKFYHLKYLNIALRGGTYDYLSQVSFFDTSPFLETFNLNVIKV
uniref:At1g61320/AtMIF1 LRR domain-containing protein n=1 Tax=Oryza nivara TaxID=4536 RepID=A0A0E0JB11_ORYNI